MSHENEAGGPSQPLAVKIQPLNTPGTASKPAGATAVAATGVPEKASTGSSALALNSKDPIQPPKPAAHAGSDTAKVETQSAVGDARLVLVGRFADESKKESWDDDFDLSADALARHNSGNTVASPAVPHSRGLGTRPGTQYNSASSAELLAARNALAHAGLSSHHIQTRPAAGGVSLTSNTTETSTPPKTPSTQTTRTIGSTNRKSSTLPSSLAGTRARTPSSTDPSVLSALTDATTEDSQLPVDESQVVVWIGPTNYDDDEEDLTDEGELGDDEKGHASIVGNKSLAGASNRHSNQSSSNNSSNNLAAQSAPDMHASNSASADAKVAVGTESKPPTKYKPESDDELDFDDFGEVGEAKPPTLDEDDSLDFDSEGDWDAEILGVDGAAEAAAMANARAEMHKATLNDSEGEESDSGDLFSSASRRTGTQAGPSIDIMEVSSPAPEPSLAPSAGIANVAASPMPARRKLGANWTTATNFIVNPRIAGGLQPRHGFFDSILQSVNSSTPEFSVVMYPRPPQLYSMSLPEGSKGMSDSQLEQWLTDLTKKHIIKADLEKLYNDQPPFFVPPASAIQEFDVEEYICYVFQRTHLAYRCHKYRDVYYQCVSLFDYLVYLCYYAPARVYAIYDSPTVWPLIHNMLFFFSKLWCPAVSRTFLNMIVFAKFRLFPKYIRLLEILEVETIAHHEGRSANRMIRALCQYYYMVEEEAKAYVPPTNPQGHTFKPNEPPYPSVADSGAIAVEAAVRALSSLHLYLCGLSPLNCSPLSSQAEWEEESPEFVWIEEAWSNPNPDDATLLRFSPHTADWINKAKERERQALHRRMNELRAQHEAEYQAFVESVGGIEAIQGMPSRKPRGAKAQQQQMQQYMQIQQRLKELQNRHAQEMNELIASGEAAIRMIDVNSIPKETVKNIVRSERRVWQLAGPPEHRIALLKELYQKLVPPHVTYTKAVAAFVLGRYAIDSDEETNEGLLLAEKLLFESLYILDSLPSLPSIWHGNRSQRAYGPAPPMLSVNINSSQHVHPTGSPMQQHRDGNSRETAHETAPHTIDSVAEEGETPSNENAEPDTDKHNVKNQPSADDAIVSQAQNRAVQTSRKVVTHHRSVSAVPTVPRNGTGAPPTLTTHHARTNSARSDSFVPQRAGAVLQNLVYIPVFAVPVLSELALITLQCFGDVLVALNRYKYAIRAFESALHNYEYRRKEEYHILNRRLCDVCLQNGDVPRALVYHLKTLQASINEGNLDTYLFITQEIAKLYIREGDYRGAEDRLRSALAFLLPLITPTVQNNLKHQLDQQENQAMNPGKAARTAKFTVADVENIRTEYFQEFLYLSGKMPPSSHVMNAGLLGTQGGQAPTQPPAPTQQQQGDFSLGIISYAYTNTGAFSIGANQRSQAGSHSSASAGGRTATGGSTTPAHPTGATSPAHQGRPGDQHPGYGFGYVYDGPVSGPSINASAASSSPSAFSQSPSATGAVGSVIVGSVPASPLGSPHAGSAVHVPITQASDNILDMTTNAPNISTVVARFLAYPASELKAAIATLFMALARTYLRADHVINAIVILEGLKTKLPTSQHLASTWQNAFPPHHAQSVMLFASVAASIPKPKLAEIDLILAQCYTSLGMYSKALSLLNSIRASYFPHLLPASGVGKGGSGTGAGAAGGAARMSANAGARIESGDKSLGEVAVGSQFSQDQGLTVSPTHALPFGANANPVIGTGALGNLVSIMPKLLESLVLNSLYSGNHADACYWINRSQSEFTGASVHALGRLHYLKGCVYQDQLFYDMHVGIRAAQSNRSMSSDPSGADSRALPTFITINPNPEIMGGESSAGPVYLADPRLCINAFTQAFQAFENAEDRIRRAKAAHRIAETYIEVVFTALFIHKVSVVALLPWLRVAGFDQKPATSSAGTPGNAGVPSNPANRDEDAAERALKALLKTSELAVMEGLTVACEAFLPMFMFRTLLSMAELRMLQRNHAAAFSFWAEARDSLFGLLFNGTQVMIPQKGNISFFVRVRKIMHKLVRLLVNFDPIIINANLHVLDSFMQFESDFHAAITIVRAQERFDESRAKAVTTSLVEEVGISSLTPLILPQADVEALSFFLSHSPRHSQDAQEVEAASREIAKNRIDYGLTKHLAAECVVQQAVSIANTIISSVISNDNVNQVESLVSPESKPAPVIPTILSAHGAFLHQDPSNSTLSSALTNLQTLQINPSPMQVPTPSRPISYAAFVTELDYALLLLESHTLNAGIGMRSIIANSVATQIANAYPKLQVSNEAQNFPPPLVELAMSIVAALSGVDGNTLRNAVARSTGSSNAKLEEMLTSFGANLLASASGLSSGNALDVLPPWGGVPPVVAAKTAVYASSPLSIGSVTDDDAPDIRPRIEQVAEAISQLHKLQREFLRSMEVSIPEAPTKVAPRSAFPTAASLVASLAHNSDVRALSEWPYISLKPTDFGTGGAAARIASNANANTNGGSGVSGADHKTSDLGGRVSRTLQNLNEGEGHLRRVGPNAVNSSHQRGGRSNALHSQGVGASENLRNSSIMERQSLGGAAPHATAGGAMSEALGWGPLATRASQRFRDAVTMHARGLVSTQTPAPARFALHSMQHQADTNTAQSGGSRARTKQSKKDRDRDRERLAEDQLAKLNMSVILPVGASSLGQLNSLQDWQHYSEPMPLQSPCFTNANAASGGNALPSSTSYFVPTTFAPIPHPNKRPQSLPPLGDRSARMAMVSEPKSGNGDVVLEIRSALVASKVCAVIREIERQTDLAQNPNSISATGSESSLEDMAKRNRLLLQSCLAVMDRLRLATVAADPVSADCVGFGENASAIPMPSVNVLHRHTSKLASMTGASSTSSKAAQQRLSAVIAYLFTTNVSGVREHMYSNNLYPNETMAFGADTQNVITPIISQSDSTAGEGEERSLDAVLNPQIVPGGIGDVLPVTLMSQLMIQAAKPLSRFATTHMTLSLGSIAQNDGVMTGTNTPSSKLTNRKLSLMTPSSSEASGSVKSRFGSLRREVHQGVVWGSAHRNKSYANTRMYMFPLYDFMVVYVPRLRMRWIRPFTGSGTSYIDAAKPPTLHPKPTFMQQLIRDVFTAVPTHHLFDEITTSVPDSPPAFNKSLTFIGRSAIPTVLFMQGSQGAALAQSLGMGTSVSHSALPPPFILNPGRLPRMHLLGGIDTPILKLTYSSSPQGHTAPQSTIHSPVTSAAPPGRSVISAITIKTSTEDQVSSNGENKLGTSLGSSSVDPCPVAMSLRDAISVAARNAAETFQNADQGIRPWVTTVTVDPHLAKDCTPIANPSLELRKAEVVEVSLYDMWRLAANFYENTGGPLVGGALPNAQLGAISSTASNVTPSTSSSPNSPTPHGSGSATGSEATRTQRSSDSDDRVSTINLASKSAGLTAALSPAAQAIESVLAGRQSFNEAAVDASSAQELKLAVDAATSNMPTTFTWARGPAVMVNVLKDGAQVPPAPSPSAPQVPVSPAYDHRFTTHLVVNAPIVAPHLFLVGSNPKSSFAGPTSLSVATFGLTTLPASIAAGAPDDRVLAHQLQLDRSHSSLVNGASTRSSTSGASTARPGSASRSPYITTRTSHLTSGLVHAQTPHTAILNGPDSESGRNSPVLGLASAEAEPPIPSLASQSVDASGRESVSVGKTSVGSSMPNDFTPPPFTIPVLGSSAFKSLPDLSLLEQNCVCTCVEINPPPVPRSQWNPPPEAAQSIAASLASQSPGERDKPTRHRGSVWRKGQKGKDPETASANSTAPGTPNPGPAPTVLLEHTNSPARDVRAGPSQPGGGIVVPAHSQAIMAANGYCGYVGPAPNTGRPVSAVGLSSSSSSDATSPALHTNQAQPNPKICRCHEQKLSATVGAHGSNVVVMGPSQDSYTAPPGSQTASTPTSGHAASLSSLTQFPSFKSFGSLQSGLNTALGGRGGVARIPSQGPGAASVVPKPVGTGAASAPNSGSQVYPPLFPQSGAVQPTPGQSSLTTPTSAAGPNVSAPSVATSPHHQVSEGANNSIVSHPTIRNCPVHTPELVLQRCAFPARRRVAIADSEALLPPHLDLLAVCETLEALSSHNILTLLAAMLQEHRILFVSVSDYRLRSVMNTLVALLYPFRWQHLLIPLLSKDCGELLKIKRPYLIGVNSFAYEVIQHQQVDLARTARDAWWDSPTTPSCHTPLRPPPSVLPNSEGSAALDATTLSVKARLAATAALRQRQRAHRDSTATQNRDDRYGHDDAKRLVSASGSSSSSAPAAIQMATFNETKSSSVPGEQKTASPKQAAEYQRPPHCGLSHDVIVVDLDFNLVKCAAGNVVPLPEKIKNQLSQALSSFISALYIGMITQVTNQAASLASSASENLQPRQRKLGALVRSAATPAPAGFAANVATTYGKNITTAAQTSTGSSEAGSTAPVGASTMVNGGSSVQTAEEATVKNSNVLPSQIPAVYFAAATEADRNRAGAHALTSLRNAFVAAQVALFHKYMLFWDSSLTPALATRASTSSASNNTLRDSRCPKSIGASSVLPAQQFSMGAKPPQSTSHSPRQSVDPTAVVQPALSRGGTTCTACGGLVMGSTTATSQTPVTYVPGSGLFGTATPPQPALHPDPSGSASGTTAAPALVHASTEVGEDVLALAGIDDPDFVCSRGDVRAVSPRGNTLYPVGPGETIGTTFGQLATAASKAGAYLSSVSPYCQPVQVGGPGQDSADKTKTGIVGVRSGDKTEDREHEQTEASLCVHGGLCDFTPCEVLRVDEGLVSPLHIRSNADSWFANVDFNLPGFLEHSKPNYRAFVTAVSRTATFRHFIAVRHRLRGMPVCFYLFDQWCALRIHAKIVNSLIPWRTQSIAAALSVARENGRFHKRLCEIVGNRILIHPGKTSARKLDRKLKQWLDVPPKHDRLLVPGLCFVSEPVDMEASSGNPANTKGPFLFRIQARVSSDLALIMPQPGHTQSMFWTPMSSTASNKMSAKQTTYALQSQQLHAQVQQVGREVVDLSNMKSLGANADVSTGDVAIEFRGRTQSSAPTVVGIDSPAFQRAVHSHMNEIAQLLRLRSFPLPSSTICFLLLNSQGRLHSLGPHVLPPSLSTPTATASPSGEKSEKERDDTTATLNIVAENSAVSLPSVPRDPMAVPMTIDLVSTVMEQWQRGFIFECETIQQRNEWVKILNIKLMLPELYERYLQFT